ncbi:zincin [Delitschia confertaspora ATCC 74209]|uniref:Mitochondrial intermediate peptidase n=1 Tax=Delitschia confertaspora ATCC 74209 TaxID=1513339 RepID=A0A9P4JRF9_9PLEO|nr:zincin [Delitschia confertaspora ATCC 74209]
MLQHLTPWVCRRCVRSFASPRRFLSSVSATAARDNGHSYPSPSNLSGLGTHDAKKDDEALRKIFDSPQFWKEFSRNTKRLKPTGLVQNRYLTHPDGFLEFVHVTLGRCERLVERVASASTVEQYRKIVKDLDRLSDLLCRVIDLADFVRGTHPSRKVQLAASKAYGIMFQYMNTLNTTTVLNDQLKKAAGMPEVYESWSEQEKVVSKILMEDFSRSAIQLSEQERQKFVDLSNEIAQDGADFVDHMAPAKSSLSFDSKRMRGLEPQMVKALTSWGETKIPTMHHAAQMALRYVEDPDVRRDIYMAVRTANQSSIRRLERMLKSRAELAKLAGYTSFAHMTLENKMAQSPEAVNQFLNALIEDTRPQVQEELQELIALKQADAHGDNFPNQINAWDKFYYTHRMISNMHSKLRTPDVLSAYFSLGTVMQGLSRLFDNLYGIRLVPRETQPGEVWNGDVRCLDVVSDTDGHIAVLYCDLFQREGKTPNPAHFTLRCSREISEEEIAEAAADTPHSFPSPLDAATDGMAVALNPTTKTYYQLPTIALICDFARDYHNPSRPTLLNFNDVRTLFHEMGHGLHSFLGRTPLQNVSGTRCATDFAELPSVLMEHFASCPSVLSLYARHWETDAPLPMAALEQRLAIDQRTQPAETESQILLAMLDQAYHSPLPLSPSFDSTKTYHSVYNTYASIPEPQGTAWQGFFGHLFGYGATYYSYLFDRAIAGKIWKDVFQRTSQGSVMRENGERYKEEVLKWGGGRSGWKCLAGVLGDERLAEGGEKAMEEVGRWGVK